MPRAAPLCPPSPFSFTVYYDGPLPFVCTGFVTPFPLPQNELASLASAFLHCLQAWSLRVQCLQNQNVYRLRIETLRGQDDVKVKVPRMKVYRGSRNRAPHSFLSWTLEAGEWASSPPLDRIGGWVDPKPGLNLSENKKISCPCSLRYNPEGRGFRSRWCHWHFSLT